ncbi:MAG TPA: filamentous hemagglutinin family protein, partial [Rhizomicrobium sp.]
LATSSIPEQDGGVVTIGTGGVSDGSINGTYGYETIQAADSGFIRVGANALIDVSGGSADAGGQVSFRAPLLATNDVAITVNGTIKGAKSVTIEPYAVWSTTDSSTGAQHFDGIIDPAGWYNADGTMVAGQWVDDQGVVQNTPTDDATLKTYLTKYYFTPDTANPDHVGFYGYTGGDAANGPGTLMGFVETPGFNFSNTYNGIANLHIRPGIELRNPGDTVRGGDIAILTNWNLGAGTQDTTTGAITLAYRYGVEAPILTVRAEHNLNIQASITDGFFQQNNGAAIQDPVTPPPPPSQAYTDALNAYNASKDFLDSNGLWNGSIVLEDGSSRSIANDPNYEPLRAPLTDQSNNYYANYAAYIGEIGETGNGYDGMWADIYQAIGGAGFLNYNPTSNPNGDTLKSPSEFTTYSVYADYYQNWLMTNFTVLTDMTPIPLQAPVDADYGAYSQNYQGIYIPGHNTYMWNVIAGTAAGSSSQLFYAPFAPRGDASPDVAVRVPVDPSHANNDPSNMPIAGSPVSLASATLLGGNSSSYRFVAGADFTAPDPLALNTQTGSGSVNIDGHFAVIDKSSTNADGSPIDPRHELTGRTLDLPTVIRTGTGDIDIAATDDLNLLDHVAPGAIYAAGAPASGTTAGTGASVLRYTDSGPGENVPLLLINDPVQATGAGDITLTTGGDINAVEQVYDTDGSRTGKAGTFLGQYWWPWMNTDYVTELDNGTRSLTETSLAFNAFDQGVMSVGGNVAVHAGGDIRELSVSLPSTFYTSDGARQLVGGGGNLDIVAGGDVLGGAYFVSKGEGRIDAGGSVASAFTVGDGNDGIVSPVSTILALQDATWTVAARGDLDIGNIMNPVTGTGIPGGDVNYSDRSAVDLTSTVGDVSILTMAATRSLYSYAGGFSPPKSLPATIAMTALDGGVTVASSGIMISSADGNLTILADKDIHVLQTQNNVTSQTFADYASFGLSDAVAGQPLSLGSGEAFADASTGQKLVDGLLHADDDQPVRIYSLTGDIVSGEMVDGLQVNGIKIVSPKPAQIRAAGDIVNLTFQGQNLYDSDVTSIIAGRDIYDVQPLTGTLPVQANAIYIQPGLIQLGGPGRLDIQAGRDLGPLHGNYVPFEGGSTPATGIQTVGNLFNPYLPRESADISVLFGVGPGVAWDSFANLYVNPAANLAGIPSVTPQLIDSIAQYEADKDARDGGKAGKPNLTADEAWAIFQTLPESQREAVIEKAFFEVLQVTGIDYGDPTSPYFGKYARGYQAINDLFPAAMGYTANNLEGGENGTAERVSTGNLDIRGTTIQTRQGGDVNIMGPGGQLLIGSASSPPYIPATGNSVGLGPEALGILALQTGAVNIFSDASLLLAQSRIFTEQGGNMTLWSSNGDINAGKGAKTSSETGAVLFSCDIDSYCYVDAGSKVTGAGIAAFPAKPGNPSPVVTLVAPRGTVDAGDAGIRVSGDLFIAAQHVANADNIQVSGKAVGLPPKPVTNLALTTASTATTEAATIAQNMHPHQDATISVEVTGFGGDFAQPQECEASANRPCR